jgi:hypothetical protein
MGSSDSILRSCHSDVLSCAPVLGAWNSSVYREVRNIDLIGMQGGVQVVPQIRWKIFRGSIGILSPLMRVELEVFSSPGRSTAH